MKKKDPNTKAIEHNNKMPKQTQVMQLNVLFTPQHHEPMEGHKKSLSSSLNWFHYAATTFPFCCSYCREKTFGFKL